MERSTAKTRRLLLKSVNVAVVKLLLAHIHTENLVQGKEEGLPLCAVDDSYLLMN